ncbi:hypothetical protein OPKNFCMD_0597 [Methylobacterium crusticola]|uniref:DUF3750 domain-containing protein n=1 Tax=Methylobacterium crusticola TaxID=1697972 RepID=A0ABQ4QSL6_9HYPH|nr:DUF3750 domain-containing protein [Methylobacterium crusticola]GJD47885.1 hypothetical protein OPKNFCMD_0597 [Methylobacterium crusticola]
MLLRLASSARALALAIILVFLAPLAAHALWWWSREDAAPDWSTADWSSARLLPAAAAAPEAKVRIYAARVGRWRGIFAHHTWIVVKAAGAPRYTRYDVVGWGAPVRTDAYAADARWFGNPPQVVLALDGEAAERAVPRIRAAVDAYPYRARGSYSAWPGPNSNTFVAHVLRAVPDLGVALPPTALGKDFSDRVIAPTPSRTGVQLSLGGYLGLTLGWVEGVEVNLLGAVAGLDLRRPALKVPGWGRIGMAPAGATGTLIAPAPST